ncbi:MAG: nuclear transport factor 2 family protein [Myxococcota bacterium]|nr:nuclear transport factor 2 family protein [Myxococcota bacterium]
MSEIPESFFHYLGAWNEPDPSRVRALLEKSVAPDVLFVDPAHTTRGVDELEAMILDAHRERPNASYVRVSGVDGHNLRYRYLWEVRMDGALLLPGMDVTTVDESGAILQIDGFFGEFPPLEG